MTDQSESEPMTIPTTGWPSPTTRARSLIDVSSQVAGGVPSTCSKIVDVVAQHGDVAHLAPRADGLAVPMDLEGWVTGHAMTVGGIDIRQVPPKTLTMTA